MSDILKIGILWMLLSIPMVWYFKPESWRSLLVGGIGIGLVIIGFIINEYQVLKWENHYLEG
jgi:hypothetical protein